MKIETTAVHAGREPDPARARCASRSSCRRRSSVAPTAATLTATPTPAAATRTARRWSRPIAALERGSEAVAFASGSAATLAAFTLGVPGGRIVCSADCYHGTAKQLREILPQWGVRTEFVDTTDLDAVERALEPGASLLWVETPSNPLLRISDLAALAELAHAAARCSAATTRSRARSCSNRSRTARTSSCTAARSTWAATATCSAASSSCASRAPC